MILSIVMTAVAAYLLGNLNGAVVISRIVAHEDVRTKGSGNAGLTNFTRNYGAHTSVFVILIDVGKAVAACLLGGLLLKRFGHYADGVALGGLCVILGHDFPALLGFKGGKGVATGLGVILMLMPVVTLIVFAVWFIIVYITKYVSLGSIVAAALVPVLAFVMGLSMAHIIFGVAAAAFIIYRHKSNISRLLNGTESKIKAKR